MLLRANQTELKSKQNSALELAKKTRMKLTSDYSVLPTILQDCKTICRYLGISDNNKWIDFELNGYPTKSKSDEESNYEIPKYRNVQQIFYNDYGQQIRLNYEYSKKLTNIILIYPIYEILEFKENCIVSSSHDIDLINNTNVIPHIDYAKVPFSQITRILGGLQDRLYEFLDKVILELEYGHIPQDIFGQIREEVDKKFAQMCPNTIKKLTVVYEQLDNKNEIVYSQIAGTCRQVIKDVADSLYRSPQFASHNTRNGVGLDDSKPINRILAFIKSKSERSAFKSMFEYTDNFLHILQQYSSKGIHSEFQQSDAVRCVLYTYILLGDVLHYYADSLTDEKIIPKITLVLGRPHQFQ